MLGTVALDYRDVKFLIISKYYDWNELNLHSRVFDNAHLIYVKINLFKILLNMNLLIILVVKNMI